MRFGEIDYRPVEQLRRLLSDASETYLAGRQRAIDNQRLMAEQSLQLAARRKAIEDERAVQMIMQDTAKELERGSVSITPTMPDVMPGTSVPISVPNVNRRPLLPQERNEVLMRGALRTAGIGESGRKVADVLSQFKEQRGTPYSVFSHTTTEPYVNPSDGRTYPVQVDYYDQFGAWGEPLGQKRIKIQGPYGAGLNYVERLGLVGAGQEGEGKRDVFSMKTKRFYNRVPIPGEDIPKDLYDDYTKTTDDFLRNERDLNALQTDEFVNPTDKQKVTKEDNPKIWQQIYDDLWDERRRLYDRIMTFEQTYTGPSSASSEAPPVRGRVVASPAQQTERARIRVRRKSDGKVGTIWQDAFDPQKHEKL